jgi:hypothetical protein
MDTRFLLCVTCDKRRTNKLLKKKGVIGSRRDRRCTTSLLNSWPLGGASHLYRDGNGWDACDSLDYTIPLPLLINDQPSSQAAVHQKGRTRPVGNRLYWFLLYQRERRFTASEVLYIQRCLYWTMTPSQLSFMHDVSPHRAYITRRQRVEKHQSHHLSICE